MWQNKFFNQLAVNRKYYLFIAAVNSSLFLLLGLGAVFFPPNFEETFYMWKLIMFESQDYTRDLHQLNDVIFWQDLLQLLYQINPHIPWHPLSLIFFTFISFLIIINTILFAAFKKQANKIFVAAAILMLTAVFGPHMLWIHQNRTAFMMSGSALVLMHYFLTYMPTNSRVLKTIAFFWFCGGLCFRPEAATAALILFIIFLLYDTRFDLRKIANGYFIFTVPVIVFFLAYSYQINFSKAFYYQLEPNVEYEIVDKRNVIPLSEMKTASDTARYKAITEHWMLADVRQNNPEFIRSLICYDANGCCLPKKGNFFMQIAEKVSALSVLEYIFPIITMFLFTLVSFKKAPGAGLYILTGLLILSMSFSINIYARVVDPFLVLLCSFTLMYIISKEVFTYTTSPAVLKWCVTFIAIWMLFAVVNSNLKTWRSIKQDQTEINGKLASFLSQHTDRKYVVIMDDFTPFNTGAFVPFTGFDNRKIIITEFGQFSGNHFFLKKNAEISGCPLDDFSCKMRFLSSIKSNIIIIAKERQLDFYSYYLHAVYGISWTMKSRSEKLYGDSYFWLP